MRRTARYLATPLALTVAAAIAGLGFTASAQELAPIPMMEAQPPVSITIDLDRSVVLDEVERATAMIRVRGDARAETVRTPVALTIVIDASGSMDGEKIVNAREAARNLITRLDPGDIVSLISYNTRSTTHLSNFAIGDDLTPAFAAITSVSTGGNTCVSCGLDSGYAALSSAPTGHIRRLVMLSDGRANRGETNASRLNTRAAEALEMHRIPTSTIGVGEDYDPAVMTQVAIGGGGAYYFMPNTMALSSILDRELAALQSTVASNVAVAITAQNGVTLGATEAAGARRDGDDIVVHLGPIGAGEERRIIVALNLPSGELNDVVSATAVFTAADGVTASGEAIAQMTRTTDPQEMADATNAEVTELQARLDSVRDVEVALTSASEGDVAGAQQQLRRRARSLRAQSAATGSAALGFEAEQLEELAGEIEAEDLDEEDYRGLTLQNYARSNEVRRGVSADEMYHQEMVVE